MYTLPEHLIATIRVVSECCKVNDLANHSVHLSSIRCFEEGPPRTSPLRRSIDTLHLKHLSPSGIKGKF